MQDSWDILGVIVRGRKALGGRSLRRERCAGGHLAFLIVRSACELLQVFLASSGNK